MSAETVPQDERLLVLGGTGNVGQYVVQWLQQHACPNVKILMGTRSPQTLPDKINAVEAVVCDLSNPSSIKAAVLQARPHRVFLCLPQALDEHAMRSSSEACAEAMLEVGASRLVRVAALGIDGDGITQGPLGAAHVAAENHIKSIGLQLSSVRPTSFHTNFVKYDMGSIRAESVFRSPLGVDARVNWVHCRDIGFVAAALLMKGEDGERGSEVVEVTGPASSTLSAPEMAALLTAELGREITYEEVDPPPFPAMLALWTFLRGGGFDKSTDNVKRVTGNSPVDFRELVRELKSQLA